MSAETALLQINEDHRTNCSVEKMKSKKVAPEKIYTVRHYLQNLQKTQKSRSQNRQVAEK